MPVFTQGKCSADAAIASPDNDHTCHCSDFDEDAAVFLGGVGVQVIAGGRCFNLARGHVEDRGMFGAFDGGFDHQPVRQVHIPSVQ